jgi:hypothetical protein
MMDEATGVGGDCDEPPGGNSPAKARAPATAPSAMSSNGGARRSRVFITCHFLSQQAQCMWRASAEERTASSRYIPTRRCCNDFGPALVSCQNVSQMSRRESVRRWFAVGGLILDPRLKAGASDSPPHVPRPVGGAWPRPQRRGRGARPKTRSCGSRTARLS